LLAVIRVHIRWCRCASQPLSSRRSRSNRIGVQPFPTLLLSHFVHVAADQLARLVASSRHQMAVAGKGFVDRRVAHELLNGLRVDSRVDQERRECMTTLMERDRLEQVGSLF
jgi:hypothetical protein